jgi:hypothetical protein
MYLRNSIAFGRRRSFPFLPRSVQQIVKILNLWLDRHSLTSI